MCDEVRSKTYEEEHAWHIHNRESDIGYEAHLVQKEKDYQNMESQMRGFVVDIQPAPEVVVVRWVVVRWEDEEWVMEV